ncbi:unnamed protein product [Onchocerca flexuosa]|uniref:NAC domain-containing protein n=1 Tax=Onchocerca flexuosa TaxID=387005 RepID=A0A183HTI6_9BILA|nr:unnamed protein product [Onchocerca flexuosa]
MDLFALHQFFHLAVGQKKKAIHQNPKLFYDLLFNSFELIELFDVYEDVNIMKRNVSNDSAVDNTMEIDYVNVGTVNMVPLQSTHEIDPNLVRDLNAQDLNPRDFDQYLQLNDNRSSATVAKPYM